MGTQLTSRTNAVRVLQSGGVIAYPTEAVYGLGCDPFNEQAVFRLLKIKRRPVQKGVIVVAASIKQVSPWIESLPPDLYRRCVDAWPGPLTWVMPLALLGHSFPYWITGDHDSVAIRVSAHPIVSALCQSFGGPIVSTSANLSGHRPLTTAIQTRASLGKQLDYVCVGKVGNRAKPTTIKELVSGNTLRA